MLVPIALHGDTDLLDGAIIAPGVNMGEVLPNAGIAPKFAPNLHEICTLATDLAQRERVAAPILNKQWKRTAM